MSLQEACSPWQPDALAKLLLCKLCLKLGVQAVITGWLLWCTCQAPSFLK